MTKNTLRPDLQQIANLIEPNTRVLDLGCYDGELLYYLVNEKNVDARGIELSPQRVRLCVQQGLSVIQGNVEEDLKHYPDKCFDYVTSSQVLQATHQPKQVLEDMLRIGKHCIISLPNFGYLQNRLYLSIAGKMPVTKTLNYTWYETPNIHFCTINDFVELCENIGATIEDICYLNTKDKTLSPILSSISKNLFSSKAIFLLKKDN